MSELMNRRAFNRLALAACMPAAIAAPAAVAEAEAESRAKREMRVHRVPELGLEIRVENEPPWDAQLMKGVSRPIFVAQSPADYYPPAVFTYLSLQESPVPPDSLPTVAATAIRRAAENYRVPGSQRMSLSPQPARYGVLEGHEASFEGWANGEAVEVKVFVGHTPGRFPVAMQAYTLSQKLAHLKEPMRRAWTAVRYLAAG
ncbi:MAG TPA: hypothetical protein VFP68_22635 [Burkholderiaceae bacterium]|nr:hypothetical protein [Burkholderiaceae bacterium]